VNTVRIDINIKHLSRATALLAACVFVAALSVPTILATTPPGPPVASRKGPPPKIDEEYALNFYKDKLPEAYTYIMVVKSKDPKTYNERFRQQMIDNTRRLTDMSRDRPEYFAPSVADSRYAFRTIILSKELHNPDPSWTAQDIEKRKADLREVASLQFDVRQQLRKLAVADQEKQLEELRRTIEANQKKIDDRDKQKDELITSHIERVLQPNPNLDW
jgi:hypothetical protein